MIPRVRCEIIHCAPAFLREKPLASSWMAVLWHDIEIMCAWMGDNAEKAVYFDQDRRHWMDTPPADTLA